MSVIGAHLSLIFIALSLICGVVALCLWRRPKRPILLVIDEAAIEAAFWIFDAERKHTGAERDAFKGQVRALLRASQAPIFPRSAPRTRWRLWRSLPVILGLLALGISWACTAPALMVQRRAIGYQRAICPQFTVRYELAQKLTPEERIKLTLGKCEDEIARYAAHDRDHALMCLASSRRAMDAATASYPAMDKAGTDADEEMARDCAGIERWTSPAPDMTMSPTDAGAHDMTPRRD